MKEERKKKQAVSFFSQGKRPGVQRYHKTPHRYTNVGPKVLNKKKEVRLASTTVRS